MENLKPLIDFDSETKEFVFNPKNFLEYYQCQVWWYKFTGEYLQDNYDFAEWMESKLFYWHNSRKLIALKEANQKDTELDLWVNDIANWVYRFDTEYDCVKYLVETWNNGGKRKHD